MVYTPTGELRRREVYDKGKRVSAEVFGAAGKRVDFMEASTPLSYQGGMSQLYTDLGKNIIYPREAPRGATGGVVYVRLHIDSTGVVREAQALPGGPALYGPVAVAAARQLKSFIPATEEGNPIASDFDVKVFFGLRDNQVDRVLLTPSSYLPNLGAAGGSSPYHPGAANNRVQTYKIRP